MPVKILFITGAGRSGSTLVDQVLGHVRGFWSGGELHSIWGDGAVGGEPCGCGMPMPQCAFWSSVLRSSGITEHASPSEIAAILDTHLRTRPRQLLTLLRDIHTGKASSSAGTYGGILHSLYGAMARVSGSRVIVDSTKLPAHALVVSAFADVDLYVLHLIRDPRAVAYSWMRNPDPSGRSGRVGFESQGKGILESTAQWVFFNLLVESVLRRRLGPRYRLLRYEDFATRPYLSVKAILEFVGEAESQVPFLDTRTVDLADNHMVGGNRSKFRRGPTRVDVDNEWERAMPRVAQRACTLLALPLLLRHHYALLRPRPPVESSGLAGKDSAA
jgi:hypothetical protein